MTRASRALFRVEKSVGIDLVSSHRASNASRAGAVMSAELYLAWSAWAPMRAMTVRLGSPGLSIALCSSTDDSKAIAGLMVNRTTSIDSPNNWMGSPRRWGVLREELSHLLNLFRHLLLCDDGAPQRFLVSYLALR